MKKLVKNKKGFSLMEILVSISIFSIVMLSAVSIFQMTIESQRNSIASQDLQDNMRYALEVMGKEIRMAKLSESDCVSLVGLTEADYKVYNKTINSEGDVLYFKNKNDDCVVYFIEDGRLKIARKDEGTTKEGFITPANIEISDLKFEIIDNEIGVFRNVQPSVVLNMNVKVAGKELHDQEMRIQTAISSRYYE